MKKTTALMLALLFSAVMLLGEAVNASTVTDARKLCCSDLQGCVGTACCPGRGEPIGCAIACEDGAIVLCNGDADVK